MRLAARFEAMVASDTRFEIPAKRHLGMVVFRLRGDNELTETYVIKESRFSRDTLILNNIYRFKG